DGKLDLYVGSSQFKDFPRALPGTSTVLRYDGTTGAFVDVFVGPDSGGLQCSTFWLTFTETNPTTLNYEGLGSTTPVSSRLAPAPAQLAIGVPIASSASMASPALVQALNSDAPILPAAPLLSTRFPNPAVAGDDSPYSDHLPGRGAERPMDLNLFGNT